MGEIILFEHFPYDLQPEVEEASCNAAPRRRRWETKAPNEGLMWSRGRRAPSGAEGGNPGCDSSSAPASTASPRPPRPPLTGSKRVLSIKIHVVNPPAAFRRHGEPCKSRGAGGEDAPGVSVTRCLAAVGFTMPNAAWVPSSQLGLEQSRCLDVLPICLAPRAGCLLPNSENLPREPRGAHPEPGWASRGWALSPVPTAGAGAAQPIPCCGSWGNSVQPSWAVRGSLPAPLAHPRLLATQKSRAAVSPRPRTILVPTFTCLPAAGRPTRLHQLFSWEKNPSSPSGATWGGRTLSPSPDNADP